MHPNLKPLSSGEILDAAFTLYRRNFIRFFGTSLAFGVAMLVVTVVVTVCGVMVISLFGGVVAVLVALLMMAAVAGALMSMWGALTWQAGRAYEGHRASMGDALDASVDSAMNLAGAGVLGMVLLIAAMLPGFAVGIPLGMSGSPVPGAVLAVAWTVAAMVMVSTVLFAVLPVVVLEERGPVPAMARSFQLASGALGRIAGVMLVALLITALPGMGVQAMSIGFHDLLNPAALAAREESLAMQLVGMVLNLLTAPFLACVCVVLYYDRRVRAEALDVRMVTDRLALAGG